MFSQSQRSILSLMTFVLASQFHVYNTTAYSGHNKEKVLAGAFSVIMKTDGSFAALLSSVQCTHPWCCMLHEPVLQPREFLCFFPFCEYLPSTNTLNNNAMPLCRLLVTIMKLHIALLQWPLRSQ